MALSLKSLAGVVRQRARRAQVHVDDAHKELHAANEELEGAIPSRDVGRIEHAQERTQHAERAVADASHELEVVGELLSDEPSLAESETRTGEGVQGLLKSLRTARKH